MRKLSRRSFNLDMNPNGPDPTVDPQMERVDSQSVCGKDPGIKKPGKLELLGFVKR